MFLISCSVSCIAGGPSGALCVYVNSAGAVVCTNYGTSSVGDEALCRAAAQASNPACGLNMGAINVAAGSCASSIFISPAVCLSNTSPYAPIGGATSATCAGLGGHWCLSSYYGFFVGNSACQTSICSAANTTLPVELINFQGRTEGSENHITWATASEHNNDYFILEHSTDGENWSMLASIDGAGNSTEIKNYEVIMVNPELVLNYYRLFQIDFDGAITSYNPIAIDNRTEKRSLIKVINILGQAVDENYRGIVLYYYSDGTHEKTFQNLMLE